MGCNLADKVRLSEAGAVSGYGRAPRAAIVRYRPWHTEASALTVGRP